MGSKYIGATPTDEYEPTFWLDSYVFLLNLCPKIASTRKYKPIMSPIINKTINNRNNIVFQLVFYYFTGG